MKFIINVKDKYKICPVCKKLYSSEDNYCSDEDEIIELIEVEFE